MSENISLEQCLVNGSGNRLTISKDEVSKPIVLRGVIKRDHKNVCLETGRDYWYIDTGYFGNFPSPGNRKGQKKWHRVVKNENQLSRLIPNVPNDRWKSIVSDDPRLKWKGWKNYDKKILLVMPNPKACLWYGVDYEKYVTETKAAIAKHCPLPVEVRIKGSRTYRNLEYSIYDAFDSGVYATVTMNSMAALESVLYGIPAFVHVPCAGHPLSSTDLTKLSNPYKPEIEKIQTHCNALAYSQFTVPEIQDGIAYKLIERYQ